MDAAGRVTTTRVYLTPHRDAASHAAYLSISVQPLDGAYGLAWPHVCTAATVSTSPTRRCAGLATFPHSRAGKQHRHPLRQPQAPPCPGWQPDYAC